MKKSKFNPLAQPVCLDFPIWLEQTAWSEHIPFAMYVIAATRPRIFVELGTYYGVSYFAFCQAVKAAKLGTKCYAVDTWEGDEHAGSIEKSLLPRLETHNGNYYAEFSRLLQTTFDNARENFADGSIDLLHIDGFHTYEAVSHDFNTWLPKMSDCGIVLFHDVNVRERDFGVWKFWTEVCEKYKNFTFLHGHGLGVLAVGEKIPEDLESFFTTDTVEVNLIRNFFHQYGARIDKNHQLHSHNFLLKKEGFFKRSPVGSAFQVWKNEGLGTVFAKAKKKLSKK